MELIRPHPDFNISKFAFNPKKIFFVLVVLGACDDRLLRYITYSTHPLRFGYLGLFRWMGMGRIGAMQGYMYNSRFKLIGCISRVWVACG